MNLYKAVSLSEIEQCVILYCNQNDNSFLPCSEQSSYENLKREWYSGNFLRVIKDSGKIRAWILANIVQLDHMHKPILMIR